MAKKFLFATLAIIVLCFCCTICYASENNSVNLGNTIEKSLDKSGKSIENVVSSNIVEDTKNTVENGINDAKNTIKSGVDKNIRNTQTDIGNYETTRASTEGTTNSGIDTMTTTTWMWIILIASAIIIALAIWYYATQNNS